MANLTGKTIAELPEDTSLAGGELFIVLDSATNKRVAFSTIRDMFFMVDRGQSANSANIDQMLTPGTFYVSDPSSVTGNPPSGLAISYKLAVVRAYGSDTTLRLWQIIQVMNQTCIEYRRSYNGTAWNDWVRLDISGTNTDVAALKAGSINGAGISTFSVAASSNIDVDVAGKRVLLITNGPSTGQHGAYTVYCYGSGSTPVVSAISAATAVTITTNAGLINVANGNSSYGLYCLMITF